jgi:hypothetical protein
LIHHASPDFWFCYRNLPEDVQRLADKAFELLEENPRHPSLRFKKIGSLWSARVNLNYRALAAEANDGSYVWFWIGTHAAYEKLLNP